MVYPNSQNSITILDMNPTQIFGTHLRPTHEYVGWLLSDEGHLFMSKNNEWIQSLMRKAHTFNSQPNQLSDFEGDNPLYKGKWKVDKFFERDSKDRIKKEPHAIRVSKGKFSFWLKGNSDFKTRNDFATHCMNLGIELELNDVEI